jgi:hypothetical protein
LVVIDAIFWAAVTTALSLAFENVYNNNLDKIPFSYVGVIAFIALGARISIGGKYSWKGIMACALTLIIGGLFFLYGIGAHIQGLF